MWNFNEILKINLHYVTLLCTAPFFHFIRGFGILNYCPRLLHSKESFLTNLCLRLHRSRVETVLVLDLPAEDCVFPQFSTDLVGFLNHQG